jgi:hypothetical protein
VILVDGGEWAEHLNGTASHPITDVGAGRGVGYAVHPYKFNKYGDESADQAEWQSAYGFATDEGRLVVATEWSYAAAKCSSSTPTVAPQFLSYLQAHGIGMTAYAGDVMHDMVRRPRVAEHAQAMRALVPPSPALSADRLDDLCLSKCGLVLRVSQDPAG